MGDYADMAWDPCDPGSWIDATRPPYRGPRPITCRRCGAKGLHWRETGRGWRLHTYADDDEALIPVNAILHVCNPADSSASSPSEASASALATDEQPLPQEEG